MWKLFSKANMPVYAWKIFLENAIKMFRLLHQIEQARLRLSGTTIIWRRTQFSIVTRFIGLHHKNKNWTDGNSVSRKIHMCSCAVYAGWWQLRWYFSLIHMQISNTCVTENFNCNGEHGSKLSLKYLGSTWSGSRFSALQSRKTFKNLR